MSIEKAITDYFIRKNVEIIMLMNIIKEAINSAKHHPEFSSNPYTADGTKIIINNLHDSIKPLLEQEWKLYISTIKTKHELKPNFFEKKLFPAIINNNLATDEIKKFKESFKIDAWNKKESFMYLFYIFSTRLHTLGMRNFKKINTFNWYKSFFIKFWEQIGDYDVNKTKINQSIHAIKGDIFKANLLKAPVFIASLYFFVWPLAQYLYQLILDYFNDLFLKNERIATNNISSYNLFTITAYSISAVTLVVLFLPFFIYLNFKKVFDYLIKNEIKDLRKIKNDKNEPFLAKQICMERWQKIVDPLFNPGIPKNLEKSKNEKMKNPPPPKLHTTLYEPLSLTPASSSAATEKMEKMQRHQENEAERKRLLKEATQVEIKNNQSQDTLPKKDEEKEFYIYENDKPRQVYPFLNLFVAVTDEMDATVENVYKGGRPLTKDDLGQSGFKRYHSDPERPGVAGVVKIENGDRRIPCHVRRCDVFPIHGEVLKARLVYIPQFEAPKYKLDLKSYICVT